jgi:flavin reductase (DIM6/NTAB) family NADH-FMN oxidoreductase RutF
MGRSDIHLVTDSNEVDQQFRGVMRRLAGGVSIITAGRDEDVTGMTVTSLTSLSASPPRLLVSVNRQASSFVPIERHRVFGVNILGSDQQGLASRFRNGRLKGAQRYEGGAWRAGVSGVPLLGNSLATVECQVEEIIERYSHGIIVGSILRSTITEATSAHWSICMLTWLQRSDGPKPAHSATSSAASRRRNGRRSTQPLRRWLRRSGLPRACA